MNRNAIMIVLTLLALAAGCGAPKTMGSFDGQKGLPQPVSPAYRMARPAHTVGSLFVASKTDYFTDLRANKVGDLVMVQIVENDKAKKKNDTKAERTNTFSAGIPNMFGYNFRRGSGEKEHRSLDQRRLPVQARRQGQDHKGRQRNRHHRLHGDRGHALGQHGYPGFQGSAGGPGKRDHNLSRA